MPNRLAGPKNTLGAATPAEKTRAPIDVVEGLLVELLRAAGNDIRDCLGGASVVLEVDGAGDASPPEPTVPASPWRRTADLPSEARAILSAVRSKLHTLAEREGQDAIPVPRTADADAVIRATDTLKEAAARLLQHADRAASLAPGEWDAVLRSAKAVIRDSDAFVAAARQPRGRPSSLQTDRAVLRLAECWRAVAGQWPSRSVVRDAKDVDQGPFAAWAIAALIALRPDHPALRVAGAPIGDALRRLSEDHGLIAPQARPDDPALIVDEMTADDPMLPQVSVAAPLGQYRPKIGS